MATPFLDRRRRAIFVTVVPEASALDEAGWQDAERIIDGALATRPARMRRQLRAFLKLIDVFALGRYGRPLAALDPDRRTRVLARFENAGILLLRRGFWGLRALILMGYYGRADAARAIGYRADPRGWEARR